MNTPDTDRAHAAGHHAEDEHLMGALS